MSKLCQITNCPRKSTTGLCFTHKPRKPLARVKRMRKIGRVGKATMDSNKAFLDNIPADELYCYYCAYIGNHYLLDRKDAVAEHYFSCARHPGLRTRNDLKVVSCRPHNKEKGSTDGDEYLKILDERKANATNPRAKA